MTEQPEKIKNLKIENKDLKIDINKLIKNNDDIRNRFGDKTMNELSNKYIVPIQNINRSENIINVWLCKNLTKLKIKKYIYECH